MKSFRKRIDVANVMARVEKDGADTRLTRGEAAALIAARTMRPYDTEEGARNRVGMQLDRACKKGNDTSLGGLPQGADGLFSMSDIGHFARRGKGRFELFKDLPANPRYIPCAAEDHIKVTATAEPVAIPGQLPKAQAMILEQWAEIRRLKQEALLAAMRTVLQRKGKPGTD